MCNQKNLKIRLQYLLFHRPEFPEEIPWDCCLRDKSTADVILSGDFMSRELASVPDLWHSCPTLLTSLGQTDSLLLLRTCLCLLSSLGGPSCRREAGLSPGVWGRKACCLCKVLLIFLFYSIVISHILGFRGSASGWSHKDFIVSLLGDFPEA